MAAGPVAHFGWAWAAAGHAGGACHLPEPPQRACTSFLRAERRLFWCLRRLLCGRHSRGRNRKGRRPAESESRRCGRWGGGRTARSTSAPTGSGRSGEKHCVFPLPLCHRLMPFLAFPLPFCQGAAPKEMINPVYCTYTASLWWCRSLRFRRRAAEVWCRSLRSCCRSVKD